MKRENPKTKQLSFSERWEVKLKILTGKWFEFVGWMFVLGALLAIVAKTNNPGLWVILIISGFLFFYNVIIIVRILWDIKLFKSKMLNNSVTYIVSLMVLFAAIVTIISTLPALVMIN